MIRNYKYYLNLNNSHQTLKTAKKSLCYSEKSWRSTDTHCGDNSVCVHAHVSIWAPVSATGKGSSPFSPSACQKHLRVCLITGPLGTPYEYIHHFPPINLSPPSLTGSVARTLYSHIPHINFQRNILSICLKIQLGSASTSSANRACQILLMSCLYGNIFVGSSVSKPSASLRLLSNINILCWSKFISCFHQDRLSFHWSLSLPVGCQLLISTNNH